jgi:translation initiation factor IF-2
LAEKKLRVHNLAKELTVSSQAIIEKCAAEGIELKNHMHVLTAGLAATIREWFSEGAHTTTLEETNRVDLASVRVKSRGGKKKAAADEESGAGVAVLEAPPPEIHDEAAPKPRPARKAKAEKPAAEAPAEPPPETKPVIEWPSVEIAAPALGEPSGAPPEAPTAPEEPVAAPPQEAADARRAAASAPTPEGPPAAAEAPVVVAGPQNIPKPARLSGPKVVRMDRPEVVDRPRPTPRPPLRPPGRPAGSTPPRLIPTDDEETLARGRGRGAPAGRVGPRAAPDAVGEKRPPVKRVIRDESQEVIEKLREWRDRDLIERRDRLAHASGRGIGGLRAVEDRAPKKGVPGPKPLPVKKDKVEMTEPILIKDFSRETGVAVAAILKKLMEEKAQLATVNSALEPEFAQLLALEQGIELTVHKAKSGLDKLADEFAALPREQLAPRPPVVTVLGHVDHGKTTLLDRIRKSNVAAGEAGGITQHIGAYRVRVGDKWVTFLDTPGHTAFTAMRARGTNLTDVVVLVVAADDGVMPTTIEAINHAKAAKTTIVVALNKIDLPHDINQLFGQLTEQGLTPSGDWGGETDVVKVSALNGEGIEDLLSHLATLSDVMELKADPTLPALGTVIEAERSEALGNVAHVLVQEGILRPGDTIVCGAAHGRVRALRDEYGKPLKNAGPSTPVEVLGLSAVPEAGDRFYVVDSAQRAKQIAEEMAARKREAALVRTAKPTNLEAMLASAKDGEIPELRVILKADVQGSIDVLQKTLAEFPSDQVRLNVIHAGVGAVTESDVVLAQASEAIVIAFHVVADTAIARLAEGLGVDIRGYKVIYNLIDEVKKALEGLLTPDEKIESRGRAEVREVFTISKVGKVAGCFVNDGVIQRNHKVRLIRDGVVIKDLAALDSLRRFKDDVKEVKAGFECGIRIAAFDDVKPGDVIEALEVVQVARKLETSASRQA